MRGRRGCYGGYYGGGGDLMGLIAVALLAIVAMPLVGGYVLVTGKDEGSKLLDRSLVGGRTYRMGSLRAEIGDAYEER